MPNLSDLLIVGSGPAGLSAALAARSLGLDVTLIEANGIDAPRRGSRALFVHHETLRRLERASPGLGARIAGFGIVWRAARTLYRGRPVYTRRYPSGAVGGALPPHASLRQSDTERFLLDACRAAGVEPVWGARVRSVRATPDGATVYAEDGREWSARYVIAADGARSAVRSSVSIALDGDRSGDYRVVVDLAGDGADIAPERVMHYRHPALGGRNVLLVPFAGGMQVDVQCHDPADSEELSTPDAVRRWLPRVAGRGSADRVAWVARYPCLQRVATSFVDGHRRVLLAGEAAHLFAPLGARGMNSAIADAEAAAVAVSAALRFPGGQSAVSAIDRYDRFRREAALTNRSRVEEALRHLRAESAWTRLAQAGAASLAPFLPRYGRWLDKAPYGPRGAITAAGGRY